MEKIELILIYNIFVTKKNLFRNEHQKNEGCAYKKEGSFKVEIDSEDLRTSIRVQDELKNTFLTHSSLISNW